MIAIRTLRKRYDSGFALSIPELDVGTNGITALLGPNGAGKSTLMRLIAGLEKPDYGTISFDGMTVVNGHHLLPKWRRNVTMVMQDPYLFKGKVHDNVAYGLRLRRIPAEERETRIRKALTQVECRGYAKRNVTGLSGGEAQRVSLARALALQPKVLLLDEPTAHIDREKVSRMEELIRTLAHRGDMTILLATHNLEQAYRLTDTIISLVDGSLMPAPPENIFTGIIKSPANSLNTFSIRNGIHLKVTTPRTGPAHVAIDPTAIIVSRVPLASSARNCVRGILATVSAHDHLMRLQVDAGVAFTVIITVQSYREMKLQPGDAVYLVFKSSAVKVF